MELKMCAKSQSRSAGAPGNYLLTDERELGRRHEKSARITKRMKLGLDLLLYVAVTVTPKQMELVLKYMAAVPPARSETVQPARLPDSLMQALMQATLLGEDPPTTTVYPPGLNFNPENGQPMSPQICTFQGKFNNNSLRSELVVLPFHLSPLSPRERLAVGRSVSFPSYLAFGKMHSC